LVERHRAYWLWLGRLETSMLAQELQPFAVHKPIYICGLARSGSTLLHEVVASHPAVATHRIKDYPMIFTPCWWRRATAQLRPQAPLERPHQDRVMITRDSPDAIEEMVWMAFFPHCHDPTVSNLVPAGSRHPEFETFYGAHIRKLLLAEKATRYAAKANYHIARLPYLVRLFPDARVLIPIRAPVSHIASLVRQQRIFSAGQRRQPRALAHMRRTGHFEFGLDRRPMNLGDGAKTQRIVQAWSAGEEIRGHALYWDMVHCYLARLLAQDERVRAAALIVPFETMCAAPRETLQAVLHHCELTDVADIVDQRAAQVRFPDYYESGLAPEDVKVIHAETATTARGWGYAARAER
jgi:hypothetical protein